MALIIPVSVGGSAPDPEVEKDIDPIEHRARNLIIPEEVGGSGTLPHPEYISPDALRDAPSQVRRRIAQEMSPAESFAVSAGRGMTTIGRGIGLVDQEDPVVAAAFREMEKERPASTMIGEVVGESAPFLLGGPLTSGASTGLRILGGALLGGTEGALITKGKGGDVGDAITGAGIGGAVGGTAEAVVPVLGRAVSKIANRIGLAKGTPLITPNGAPTPEFTRALRDAGMSFDDISNETMTMIKSQGSVDPVEAARRARFEEQGIPYTKGDISQDFAQQADESRLISMASGESGEPLRQMRLDQSEIIKSKIDDLITDLGVTDDVGETIKDALSGRKDLLQKEKRQLYNEVASIAPEAKSVPVATDSLRNSILDADTLDDLSITAPEAVVAYKKALARFGIDDSEEALELLGNIEPQPLTVGNFERFRKTLNAIDRADQTGASKVMTKPMLSALDGEADLLSDALVRSGLTDESVTGLLKEARGKVRTIKTEFSPQSITGRLIDAKRDGVTPVIQASQVRKKLVTPTAPIEDLRSTLNSLAKSGDKGRQATRNLQASVVLDALNEAFKAPSRKTSGVETFGGNQFAKHLDKLDADGKLSLLFKSNPEALKRLKGLSQTAKDITPTAGAVPKGSAPVILDALNTLGAMKGIAAVRDVVKLVINAGADDRAVAAALKAKPTMIKAANFMNKQLPDLAAALGIPAVLQITKEEEEN